MRSRPRFASVRSSSTAWVLLVAALLSACASGPKTQADRVREMLEVLAESHQRDTVFLVRLNPVACECPEWEVRLDGTWYRAFLEPSGEPVESIRAALRDGEGRPLPGTARVLGKLSTSIRVSGNRTQCLVLKVFAPCQQEECGSAP